MCNITESYIKKIVPYPLYSEVFHKVNTVNTVTGFLELDINYHNQSARVILVHNIILSVRNVAQVTTLKDQFNKEWIKFFQDTSMNGAYYFNSLILSPRIFLTMDFVDNGENFFIVQYQYIYDQETKAI